MADLQEAAGLWLKDGKSGKYMSGSVEEVIPAGATLFVFKNTYKKEGDNQPDYRLMLKPVDDQPAVATTAAAASAPPADEEIPF